MRFIYNKYKGNKTIYYLQQPLALDIETSWNHSDSNPICWITSIQTYFNGDVKIFRTAPEWLLYMKELYEYYELDKFHRLMIIVHNLSYDISYLLPFLQCAFPYGLDERRMLNDGHKITCYTQGGLEFRDTFALVNKSLARWGKDMAVEHPKAEGLYDYDKIIFPDDELTSEEELYDINDVLCLYEAFRGQLDLEGDTVVTVPYTATGYRIASPGVEEYKGKPVRAQLIIPPGAHNIMLEGEMPCRLLNDYQVRPMTGTTFTPTLFGSIQNNKNRRRHHP